MTRLYEVKSCKTCPNLRVDMSCDRLRYCKLAGKSIAVNVEHKGEWPKEIPRWCPLPDAGEMARKKVNVYVYWREETGWVFSIYKGAYKKIDGETGKNPMASADLLKSEILSDLGASIQDAIMYSIILPYYD